MRAVVKYAPGERNVDIIDIKEDACGSNEVRLKIGSCGVCGTGKHVRKYCNP
jgi:threonine dehydrogenase-like Zn-dependent dehydrogenase